MTLSSTANRISYAGNGSTKAFAFPYRFLANSDLVVIETVDATGVQTTKTLTSDYTVSGAGDSGGGTVTMVTAPASGVTLTVYRDVPLTQTLNLIENSIQSAEELEAAYDRRAMADQRLKEMITRALRQPEGDSADIGRLPALASRKGKFLFFNATTGDPEAADSVTGAAVSPFLASLLDDNDAAEARGTLGITGTTVDIFAADYGATGDGSTDDTSALQDAIDACVAGQRLRLTPNKTYITTGLTLDNAGMVLDLNGATLKLKTNAGSGAKLMTIAADDVSIVGPGTLDGNKANQSVTTDQNAVFCDGYDRFVLDGFRITGTGGHGCYLVDTTDSLVRGLRVDATIGTAIQWGYDGEDLTRCITQDCYIDRSDDASYDGGCVKYSKLGSSSQAMNDCAIVNVRAKMHNTPTGSDVVPLEFWGSGRCNKVLNSHVQGGQIGISIANGQSHGLIGGCTTFDVNGFALEIADAIHCAVVGNVVDGNANSTRGIQIDGANTAADGTSVIGNTIRRCTDSGIYFYTAAPGSVASGNTIDVADAHGYGIYSNLCGDLTLASNNIEGNGTALQGIVIVRASDISLSGNNIANFTAQVIIGVQNAAGTMDNIAITGGSISGGTYIDFQASGGGALGTDITLQGVAGWTFGSCPGDVWDWKNFRGAFRGTGTPEGNVTAGIGSTFIQTDGTAGNQFWIKESGTGNTGWRRQDNTFRVEVTVAHSDLAASGTKTLVAALSGARFKLRDILLSGSGTNFSGGGGDRDIAIQDSSGTTIWSVLTAAKVQSLAATRWGDSGVPFPATAAHLTAQSVAGEALVAKYSGGTADYGAGSLTLILEYERTT